MARKAKAEKKLRAGRVVYFGKSGNIPTGSTEAAPVPLATPEPPQVMIPEGQEAEAALKDIAELNRRVQRAHQHYVESAAETKERRENWQALAEQLQTLIAVKTTRPDMPLFDATQAEADRQQMLAPVTPAAVEPPPSAPEGAHDEFSEPVGDNPGPIDIFEPVPALADDEVPF